MKKFSRTATAGLGAVAALALAACSPPHQQPSDIKTDNASTFEASAPAAGADAAESTAASTTAEAAAEGDTQFIDCVSTPTKEPATISLNCQDTTSTLTDIVWESWEADTARGTGTRTVAGETTEGVSVVLSNPTESAQGTVFSQITVDGAVVTP